MGMLRYYSSLVLTVLCRSSFLSFFFFFNDTATTEIYTLSLHDALPISPEQRDAPADRQEARPNDQHEIQRSEEHTSELQSPCNLVCRLLLEKKKNKPINNLQRCGHPPNEKILQH